MFLQLSKLFEMNEGIRTFKFGNLIFFRQKNQMKQEERRTMKLNKTSEERDSYRNALQFRAVARLQNKTRQVSWAESASC